MYQEDMMIDCEEQVPAVNGAPPHNPHSHSTVAIDPSLQRQHQEYPPPSSGSPPQPPATEFGPTTMAADVDHDHQNLSPNISASAKTDDKYHLMPIETESSQPDSKQSQKTPTQASDKNEVFEAQVALGIQMAMFFFCLLIFVAVFLAVFSHSGYWVVIVVCLGIILSLLVGLVCFLYKVVHEDAAPGVNQKHMPQWYRTLRKLVKDEISGFREDWIDMCNNMYLLEDGVAETVVSEHVDTPATEQTGEESPQLEKPKKKKRKGKSALFKLVAKPAAVLAGFRLKRKAKKAKKKAQQVLP